MRVVVLLLALAATASAAPDGAALYKAQCARCHGDAGQGKPKKYEKPLVGDLSPAQLADVVRKTMPENEPGTLTADEATAIAVYMTDAFYSPVARERFKPARVDLARLTVPQYRHAVADLFVSFRAVAPQWPGGTGLRGEYFANRSYGKKQFERTDPAVKFDFGTAPPDGGKFDEPEFSARWSGSVLAPATGEYTFAAKSDQAVLLWVNQLDVPVVNAKVRSGTQTEYRVQVFLVGGRIYPLKFEFSKALQGVKDKKPKPVPAFVSLEWKPPHGQQVPIPTRFLTPTVVLDQHVVAGPFPPDDQSAGWARGTAVSKEWDAAATEAAVAAAHAAVADLPRLARFKPTDPTPVRLTAAKAFARSFAERAFRRPLTADLQERYVTRQFSAAGDDIPAAVTRVVLLVLKSPRFLFREVADVGDGFDAAARLSFALWDSIPDLDLRTAAAKGELKTKAQLLAHAERMLADPRAKAKLRGFLLHWLRLEGDRDLGKSTKAFPGFDAAAVADLRTSLELFLDEAVWTGTADFRTLLTADDVYLNGRLAKLYGADLAADAAFTKVKLDAGQRAGVLTHPYLLSAFAYAEHSSPIHRGVFLAKGVLGTGLKPPQEAFTPLPAEQHPGLTTRERVALQTKGPNCQTCHTVINNLGFALENFDAVGKFRTTDNQKPVDATGEYLTRAGERKAFNGAVELAKVLAANPDVHSAFAEQLFHHLIQQPVRAYGPTRAAELRDSFAKSGYNIRTLAAEVAAGAALSGRAGVPAK